MPPVTSLEVSKRMKELRFEQESYFCWVMRTYEPGLAWNNPSLCLISCYDFNKSEYHRVTDEPLCSAYLSDEIAEMLPPNVIHISKDGDKWSVLYGENLQSGHGEFDVKLSGALAKMAIYLKEQKII